MLLDKLVVALSLSSFAMEQSMMAESTTVTPRMIAGVIDHTFLKTDKEGLKRADQDREVTKLVAEAHKYGAYSVCVREAMVPLARQELKKLQSPVKLTSVIGFPDGDQFTTAEKIRLLVEARENGADEFDMVIPYKALKKHDFNYVYQDVYGVAKAAGDHVLKVIFENSYLDADEKPLAYRLVYKALADAAGGDAKLLARRFLKTSTGFALPPKGVAVGATLDDVKLMYEVTQGRMGIKPAGGVNSFADAVQYFRASGSPLLTNGAIDPMKFRIGTSSLLGKLFGGNGKDGY